MDETVNQVASPVTEEAPQPQQNPTNTPPPPPQKLPRIFFIAIFLVIVLFVTVIGLTVTSGSAPREKKQEPPKAAMTPTVVISQASPEGVVDVPKDWETTTNTTYNYSVRFPPSYTLNEKYSPHSTIIEMVKTTLGPGEFPSLYVSVIPEGTTASQSAIYNYLHPSAIRMFSLAKVGDTVNTNSMNAVPGEKMSGEFKRIASTTVAGENAVVVENAQPLAGFPTIKERRVFMKKGMQTYAFGTYYSDTHELDIFNSFLKSFVLY